MRAFIVAHAGPFVAPSAAAAVAFIEVDKPGHAKSSQEYDPSGAKKLESVIASAAKQSIGEYGGAWIASSLRSSQ